MWVTTPQYYLGEDGLDRKDLDPSLQSDPGGWWTCHKNTKRGDLVLLYRTKPKMDFGYLIQAETDAYSIADDQYACEQGWDYGCDYHVLYKFQHPLTLHDPLPGDLAGFMPGLIARSEPSHSSRATLLWRTRDRNGDPTCGTGAGTCTRV